jgi:hypothetical protein
MTGRGSNSYSKVNSPNRSVEKPLETRRYAKERDRSMAFLLKADPMRRSSILRRAKTRLDAVKERLYQKRTERDIFWLTKRIICYNNYRPVEIGVFKGDTAVSVIQLVQKYSVKVEYVIFLRILKSSLIHIRPNEHTMTLMSIGSSNRENML